MDETRSAKSLFKAIHSKPKAGFTLVELMVVVAISAILASVAIPAYVNYVNRAKQTEAVEALMQAKFDQEFFWADAYRYADTIRCLASFGGNCADTNPWLTTNSYRIWVTNADAQHFTIKAKRTIAGVDDNLTVSDLLERPSVETPNALKWSIFKWIFG